MAELNGITINTSEYRPCLVHDRKALFHRWSQNIDVEFSNTTGIVEYGNGEVQEVRPENIRFLDYKVRDYCIKV